MTRSKTNGPKCYFYHDHSDILQSFKIHPGSVSILGWPGTSRIFTTCSNIIQNCKQKMIQNLFFLISRIWGELITWSEKQFLEMGKFLGVNHSPIKSTVHVCLYHNITYTANKRLHIKKIIRSLAIYQMDFILKKY